MLDTLLNILETILVIIGMLIIVGIPLFIYVWIRTNPERRRIKKFSESAATRQKISDVEFCCRSHLSNEDRPLVRALRAGLGREVKIDSEFIYPEDEICSYGFQYDDSVSGFVYDCGLIAKDPFWFPMEKGSTVRDIFPWIHQIKSEQGGGGNSAALRASP